MNTGINYKKMRKVFLRVVIIAIIPLLVMGGAFCASMFVFADKLKENGGGNVVDATVSTLWIWLVILAIGIIVLMFCTMYMVDYIYRHFRAEEAYDIERIVTQEQNEFMTLVNREMNNPMDTINVLSDKILEEEVSSGIREKVLGIREAANSLTNSFNSISEYVRLESEGTKVNADEYELTKLVSESCKKINPGLELKKLDFHVEYDEKIPNRLKGDHARIRQILDNLLENAVKYTYEGGISLTVGYRTIAPEKVDIVFTVTDSGIGIRKEDAQKLFLSIGKLGQSKDISIKGTGLGLLICKRLVNILDGRISVDSETGKGSTFRFMIPQDVQSSETVGESLSK